jgi:hypothetical protein
MPIVSPKTFNNRAGGVGEKSTRGGDNHRSWLGHIRRLVGSLRDDCG